MSSKLTLSIDGEDYLVTRLLAPEAWRLAKVGARGPYEVTVSPAGRVVCSCPDFVHRHDSRADFRCKHGRALVAELLIRPPDRPESSAPPAGSVAIAGEVAE